MNKQICILLLLSLTLNTAAANSILSRKRVPGTFRNIAALKKIALTGKKSASRNRALFLLERMRSVRTLAALSEILRKTKDGQLRDRTAFALTRLPNLKGYRTLEYGTSLTSSPTEVRISCLKALSATLGKKITHMVNLLLRDNNYRIRFAAASVLNRSATRYNVYHMNRLLIRGNTVAMKKAVARGMLALNSRRTRGSAMAVIDKENDPALLATLLKHLLKTGGCPKDKLARWSKDSGKPESFRKKCMTAIKQ